MKQIKLSDIRADQRAQPRAAIMIDKVDEYIEDMQRGDKFPPLVTFFDAEVYWLGDGFHRYYAATAAGLKVVECDVQQGGVREAILFSCGANAAHGLRRTNEDKRRAVTKLLQDGEWSHWSDAEIARRATVSPHNVAKLRKELEEDVTVQTHGDERTYRTKHGTVSRMKITPRTARLDGVLIAKSLHDIERHMDMLPSPDEAAANFPQDQHYLFPVSKLDEMADWMARFAAAWRTKIEVKANAAAGG